MLVTTPEETPVSEAIETAFTLEDRVGIALGPIVVNGIYATEAATETATEYQIKTPEQPVFDRAAIAASISVDAQTCGVLLKPNEIKDIVDAVAFQSARGVVQSHQVERLRESLPIPQLRLPYLFDGEIGFKQIEKLADALETQILMLPDPIIGEGATRDE
jgi:hypothetical protein